MISRMISRTTSTNEMFRVWPTKHHHSPRSWLRLVGSLKLQVSFAGYSLFYRAPLQKRPITLKSLLIVATP